MSPAPNLNLSSVNKQQVDTPKNVLTSNCTRVQPDFYFSIVMSMKKKTKKKQIQKVQRVVAHLMSNNTIIWFTLTKGVIYNSAV